MGTEEFTIFVGGPDDVRDEHARILDLIVKVSEHYPSLGRIAVKHWNLGSEAIPAPSGADYQAVIDEKKPAAECDIVLMLFRGKLGRSETHHGRHYDSSSTN